ncbi:crotonase/enoyl-CoA hydratase family protein [Rhodococcus sp. T7]|uniref:crotonase/enoyl-CoA hydratase family protein n=1 Tax=Rhodococcus sp. T7 TaxID=627444 RepID=UPI00135BAC89|nr:crotonase/enoyl-CoA hydratase family protein [Rhodococcus sp. T7]KAF0956991.1 Enoyl-CoA-hydratase [Rhodococcus sp. T7]KAF0958696.1 Enoyl-CoA-hydratase [Rhodococcus sp. T7]
MTPAVDLTVEDGVAVITIDRPEVRNAIDLPTARQLAAALDDVDQRSDIRAAVLTGTGTVFSAGMDLKAFSATGERPLVAERGAFGICERATTKPLIAAVEGKALGGGFEIALACDLVVAAQNAQFGLPEVKRGLVAAAGGVLRLPRVVPHKVALELVMTGDLISATEAHRLGVVNRVVAPGEARAEAMRLAAAIAANAPMAVRTAKFLVNASADWQQEEFFDRQRPYTDKVRGSADAAEGARAFVDKRAPVWADR